MFRPASESAESPPIKFRNQNQPPPSTGHSPRLAAVTHQKKRPSFRTHKNIFICLDHSTFQKTLDVELEVQPSVNDSEKCMTVLPNPNKKTEYHKPNTTPETENQA